MRLKDWESRLNKYLEINRGRKFRWGHFDCCIFAAGAVDAMTNTHISHVIAGSYLDSESAMRMMLKLKCKNVFELAENVTGFRRVELSRAQRGDICGHAKTDEYPLGMLGIVIGHLVIFAGENGLCEVRIDQLPPDSFALEVV